MAQKLTREIEGLVPYNLPQGGTDVGGTIKRTHTSWTYTDERIDCVMDPETCPVFERIKQKRCLADNFIKITASDGGGVVKPRRGNVVFCGKRPL